VTSFPALFVSHGAPTFALEPGIAGPRLTALGRTLPRPEAVLVAAGAAQTALPACVIEGGMTHGVLLMDAFLFGQEVA